MDSDTRQLSNVLVDDNIPISSEDKKHAISIPLGERKDNLGFASEGKKPAFFGGLHLSDPAAKPVEPPKPSFWQVEYYQEYFDLSTEVATKRIIKALWPFGPDSFVETEHKVDLYVPLWTFITLIISMSTFGNIVHGIRMAHANSQSKMTIDFDVSKVTTCASILLFYVVINPLIFYLALKWKGAGITIAELLCLYGYSYVPFIPMSLLFALQFPIFQVVVLFGAASISVYFLYRNLGELCRKYLGNLMFYVTPYMIIIQIIFVCLVYFKIYT